MPCSPIGLVGGGVLGVIALGLVVFFFTSRERQFVLVPKGKSWLGGGGGKPGDIDVVIPHDFYLGKFEGTQEEWEKVMGTNPSLFSRTGGSRELVKGIPDADLKRFPVENVSWEDAQAFLERVNSKVKDAGWVYRLPKEAEWEYACRGGPGDKIDSGFDFYFEKPTNLLLPDQANFDHRKGLTRTCRAGSYPPNRLGLYDMHGNVWEWCEDQFDPKMPKDLRRRLRGGGWDADSGSCRAALVNALPLSHRSSSVGLRLARVPVGKATK